ncbi:MAG: 23S rRNA pseudouridine(955/2504/2580) synthase RluC [Pseudomonadota bacterium]
MSNDTLRRMNHATQNFSVTFVEVDEDTHGQRVDNFLITHLKGVPKSRIYRILRKGEVRVNKKRVKPEYKLQNGDLVRIPPVRMSEANALPNRELSDVKLLEDCILYEDKSLIVINKPSGIAVHGGSGQSFGVIEGLRALRSDAKFLELVHRIDRDTSGCLVIAKKRSILKGLHQQLAEKSVKKQYIAIVDGLWPSRLDTIKAPLLKNQLRSGERVVRVDAAGKPSITKFQVLEQNGSVSLVKAAPITGRTHQIRVHSQFGGAPILGDTKYQTPERLALASNLGVRRLCLHAYSIAFTYPGTSKQVEFFAPLGGELTAILDKLSLNDTNLLR